MSHVCLSVADFLLNYLCVELLHCF